MTDEQLVLKWSNKMGLGGLSEDQCATLENFCAFVRAQPAGEADIIAWVHESDSSRAISASQKAGMMRDGGAGASSVRSYSVAAYAAPPAATNHAETMLTTPQAVMLRSLLVAIRPEYGAPGSRDVEVGRQQQRIDAALAILDAAAPESHALGDDND